MTTEIMCTVDRSLGRSNHQLEHQNTGLTMKKLITDFAKNDSGATAIEYALIAAIVGIGIITALNSLKTQLNATFNLVSTDLTTANAE